MDETVGFIGMPTEIVCVNGRYAYAAMHHSAASGGEMAVHLGLILSSADGAIREYALEAVETTSPWGECQLAALGEGTMEQAKAMRRRYIEEYNLLADRIEQNV